MLRATGSVLSRYCSRSAAASFSTQAAAPAAAPPAEAPVPESRPSDYGDAMRAASELGNPVPAPPKEIGMCSGVPLETFNRKVRIFSAARSCSQSGQARTTWNKNSPSWEIEFTTTAKWENPLIGWTSTADPLENVGRALLNTFDTPEQAAAFASRQGWSYVIEYPAQKRAGRMKRYLGYGDNFSTKRKGLPDLSSLPSNRGVGGK